MATLSQTLLKVCKNPKLTFEELFETLPDREELEYQLDSDETPYCAMSKSRFDTPEHSIVFIKSIAKTSYFPRLYPVWGDME